MTSAGDASHLIMEMRRIFCRSDRLDTEQKSKIFSIGLSPGHHLSLFQSLQVRLTFSSLFCSCYVPSFFFHPKDVTV